MQSGSTLLALSSGKALRAGQRRVIETVAALRKGRLTAQLPTGYGKTLTAAGAYRVLQQAGTIDRLLYVTPTLAQLNQFVQDGAGDLKDCGVTGPLGVIDLGEASLLGLKRHRSSGAQVFATNVQALAAPGSTTLQVLREGLLTTGSWMIVVDECHHYGLGRAWGELVAGLRCEFLLAMSATPFRKGSDEAFGQPDVVVTYREAVEEGAVKRLECHAYIYRIDAVLENGEIRTYTTAQLVDEVGSDHPDAIERFKLKRQMRWSPKYVSPLVDRPLARLLRTRIENGGCGQAIIGAMSCSHAQLVCDQIRAMYPELRTDWVGTGDFGRKSHENADIIKRFCPPKRDGRRCWQDVKLDVLVHVAMAGEGLDSVFVSEVVHLNPANINNQNNQENGRAARVMPGIPAAAQMGRISVDSCSPYAEHTGKRIMAVLDGEEGEAVEEPDDDEGEPGDDIGDLPETRDVRIYDMELERIDEGHEEVARMARAYCQVMGLPESVLEDREHKIHAAALSSYLEMRRKEAEQHNTMAVLRQWQETTNQAVGVLVRTAIDAIAKRGSRIEKSLVGDLKKRVHAKRCELFGRYATNDVEDWKRQYGWLVEVQRQIKKSKELPSWLA